MVTTKYDLGIEYLGGLRKPTVDDVGKLAVVALDSLGRPNFEYLTQTASVADDTFASTLAPHLRGVGLTVDASGNLRVRPRPRRPLMQDYFVSGGATSGSIGALGWSLNGSGTPAFARASGNFNARTGLLDTSSTANHRSSLTLGGSESMNAANPIEMTTIQACWDHNADLANVQRFFGFNDNFANQPSAAVNCLGIYYDSAVGPNYQIIGRNASVGTPIDTGVPAPSNTAELITLHKVSTGWQFYSGNTLLGTVPNAAINNTNMNLGFRIETLTAAAKRWRIGFFGATGDLVGALDDDTFLET